MALDTIWQDVRYGVRGLGRNPGFSSTAILSLVLGIGASLAIFTVADNLLLRPLPYREPGKLVMVWEKSLTRGFDHNVVAPGNFIDWVKQNDVFESMAGVFNLRAVLTVGNRTEEFGNQITTPELLPMLGVQPLRGRLFTADDAKRGARDVYLISYRLWQGWFGGDEGIVGKTVQINSKPGTIVGVLPPGFSFRGRDIDLWEPLGFDPSRDYRKSSGRWMNVTARVKPGVSLATAQAHMDALGKRYEQDFPEFDKGWGVTVEPLRDSMVRDVKTSLVVLLAAVGLLLAVACANVANLLLARYTARRRELAVRLSLGAEQGRLIRQLLTESLMLGIAGGLAGLIAAKWAVLGLVALAPLEMTESLTIVFDGRIVVAAFGLSILSAVVFGVAPALAGVRGGIAMGLRESARSNVAGAGRLRSLLVGGEVALSVMLLVGGMLLFRSFAGLQAVQPGIDPSNVLTFRVSIPNAKYPKPEDRTRFFTRAVEAMGQLPGVRSASAVSYLPFHGDAAGTWVNLAGRPPARPGEELVATIRTIMPGYFRTMGIPLKAGRDFTASDNEHGDVRRFIVNEAFARQYLAGEQPLGKPISVLMQDKNPYGEIVGVVGDVKEGSLDQGPKPTVYYPEGVMAYSGMVMVVKTDLHPAALTEPARRAIQSLDAAQPIADVKTMQEIVEETFARQRFSAILLAGFSLAALLLAAVGIYGVLAYSVTERTREIGVRVALGAQPGQIVAMVVGGGARLVAAGTAAGIAGALALSGLLKGMLFGVGPRDVATYVAVPAVLAVVALAASWLPARRASRLEPMNALRE
jgi:putative ABC transport system permease protein